MILKPSTTLSKHMEHQPMTDTNQTSWFTPQTIVERLSGPIVQHVTPSPRWYNTKEQTVDTTNKQ